MKQPAINRLSIFLGTIFLFLLQVSANAQDKITIREADVSSWFSRNWIWVVAGVVLLLLIIIFGSSSRSKRRTTTVVKDQFGDVRSVTTTEVKS